MSAEFDKFAKRMRGKQHKQRGRADPTEDARTLALYEEWCSSKITSDQIAAREKIAPSTLRTRFLKIKAKLAKSGGGA